ncbi:MAG: TonB-dependent receptor, partial [Candidatus Aminicenantes bacterium]|nr:TonB-dependent receptor [Candidatus Aminicenantes bacterium]
SGVQAVTDAAGGFRLNVPDAERLRIEVVHPDYYEQEYLVHRKATAEPVVLTLVPLIRQREEVVVTALRHPELSTSVPAAGSVVTAETMTEKMAPTITEALQEVPGVAALGSGGFSLVPTVRGLARRRVLYLIDNARLESDRRTGPNASFVSPEDLDRLEVLRSPASVLYGSDAIGGVIHLLTRNPMSADGLRGRVTAGYGSVNRERNAGLALDGNRGAWGFYLSFQGVDADNYSSPLGKVLQSQYTQGSLLGKLAYRTERREVLLSFLGARGTDIGKPNRTSAEKPTWYPRETQNLAQLKWQEKNFAGGELTAMAFANPNFLETRTDTLAGYKAKESFSRTESTEFGFQLAYNRRLNEHIRLEGGVDYFGRGGAAALNRDTSFDAQQRVTMTSEERPFTNGSRRDAGLFLTADVATIRNLDLIGGIRWDSLTMKADPGGKASVESQKTAATGFLAASYRLPQGFVVFANVSRAYRVPSLSELFYTGISGRGFIISNPDLEPETSFNVDGGLKCVGRRLFLGLYAFRYEIDDMIERYKISSTVYTYGNINRGRIEGLEFEFEAFPVSGWKLFGNLMSLRGKDPASGVPLNDVPPFRAVLGSRFWLGRLSFEATGIFQAKKDRPGPAEIAIDGCELVNLKAAYTLGSSLSFYFRVGNLFNETFLARPDSEAMEEPGRSASVGLAFSF